MAMRSAVTIQIQEKGYEMIRKAMADYSRINHWNFEPDRIYRNGDDYILQWDSIRWYSDYDDVFVIKNVLNELKGKKDSSGSVIDGYKFGLMEVSEDNQSDVDSNDSTYPQIYVEAYVPIPDGFEKI